MQVLNNKASTDQYSEANTLLCPQTIKVNITVANAAIFMETSEPAPGVVAGGAAWKQEVYRPPGYHNLIRRTEGVRFRSAVAGVPAQVTVEAINEHDS